MPTQEDLAGRSNSCELAPTIWRVNTESRRLYILFTSFSMEVDPIASLDNYSRDESTLKSRDSSICTTKLALNLNPFSPVSFSGNLRIKTLHVIENGKQAKLEPF